MYCEFVYVNEAFDVWILFGPAVSYQNDASVECCVCNMRKATHQSQRVNRVKIDRLLRKN